MLATFGIINLTPHNVILYDKERRPTTIKPEKVPLRLNDPKIVERDKETGLSRLGKDFKWSISPEEVKDFLLDGGYHFGSVICVSKSVLIALHLAGANSETTGYFFISPNMKEGVIKDYKGKTLGITGFLTFEEEKV